VLIVRGADADGAAAGRDWLAQQLLAAGATVSTVLAYRRAAPQWSDAERSTAAQAAADGSVWLFSSSEAVAHLRQLLPMQSWHQARAVATHGRIAQAAEQAGFGVVRISRPTLKDVVASIKSVHVQPG
jgi:uroporphyrinogen-III synthase